MPELPEVESGRRLLERKCVGRSISRVVGVEQGGGPRSGQFDEKVLCKEENAESFEKKLMGRVVVGAHRKGKQLWLALDDDMALLMHLGMTGALLAKGEEVPSYKNSKFDDESWPPRFSKFELGFGDECVAFCDSRRFGRVSLRKLGSEVVDELARDPLNDCPSIEDFVECMGRVKKPIKGLLLDQRALVSGVGNWIADEVLYTARIYPGTKANELSEIEVKAVRDAIRSVVKVACDADAKSELFPPTWLFHHRWQKQTSGSVDSEIGRIHFETIAGRTTAYLPHVQKKKKKKGAP